MRRNAAINQTPVLKYAHLAVGWLALAAFVWSGLYLRYTAPSVYLGDQVSRMMFVANHVYILLAGLANITIGRYVTPLGNQIGKGMQSLGMALMMVGTVVLIYAFTIEPMLGSMDRPRTQLGIFFLVGGVLSHLMSGLSGRKNR